MGRLLACSRCKTVAYCSPACQKSDWKRHKPTCMPHVPGSEADAKASAASQATTQRNVFALQWLHRHLPEISMLYAVWRDKQGDGLVLIETQDWRAVSAPGSGQALSSLHEPGPGVTNLGPTAKQQWQTQFPTTKCVTVTYVPVRDLEVETRCHRRAALDYLCADPTMGARRVKRLHKRTEQSADEIGRKSASLDNSMTLVLQDDVSTPVSIEAIALPGVHAVRDTVGKAMSAGIVHKEDYVALWNTDVYIIDEGAVSTGPASAAFPAPSDMPSLAQIASLHQPRSRGFPKQLTAKQQEFLAGAPSLRLGIDYHSFAVTVPDPENRAKGGVIKSGALVRSQPGMAVAAGTPAQAYAVFKAVGTYKSRREILKLLTVLSIQQALRSGVGDVATMGGRHAAAIAKVYPRRDSEAEGEAVYPTEDKKIVPVLGALCRDMGLHKRNPIGLRRYSDRTPVSGLPPRAFSGSGELLTADGFDPDDEWMVATIHPMPGWAATAAGRVKEWERSGGAGSFQHARGSIILPPR